MLAAGISLRVGISRDQTQHGSLNSLWSRKAKETFRIFRFSSLPASSRLTENLSFQTYFTRLSRKSNEIFTYLCTSSHKSPAHCGNRENLANFSSEKNDGVKSPFFTSLAKFLIVEKLLFFKFVSSYFYAFYNHYVHSSIV